MFLNASMCYISRYIFFFLLPLLPECILQRSDFKVLSQVYRGRKNGVKAITVDELEAYKYNFSRQYCILFYSNIIDMIEISMYR